MRAGATTGDTAGRGAAGVDEAYELARRASAAERTAEMWHAEYKIIERTLFDVYRSVWWRTTAPLRRLVEMMRRRIG